LAVRGKGQIEDHAADVALESQQWISDRHIPNAGRLILSTAGKELAVRGKAN
jgi:hypothetical protein